MRIKIIKSYRDIVAICDSELLGKRFEEGELQLEIKESFFNGDKLSETEVFEVMKKMYLFPHKFLALLELGVPKVRS